MSDDFSARYRLLKCVLVEDGTRTHNAQELASGRVVMVHITDAAGPDEVDALRTQLAALSPADRNKVLEAVTLPSGFAVVTEFLPAPLTFRSWLTRPAVEVTAAPPVAGGSATLPVPEPGDGAVSEITVEVPLPPFAPAVPAPPGDLTLAPPAPAGIAPPEGSPMSFSALFGAPVPPAPPPVEEYPRPSAAHLSVSLGDAATPAPVVPPVLPPVAPPPMVPPMEPPPMVPPPEPVAPAAEPGEFTRMFSPAVDASAAALPPVPPAPVAPPLSPPLAPAPSPALSPMASPLEVPPPGRKPPGEFTLLFGAPETAAPLPETMRPSPMREAPPPAFSPLTPERQLESPPVEPRHRVVTANPNYLAGIQQDGPSPIAPNVVGNSPLGLPPLMPMAPPPPAPPAHLSPLFAAAGPPAPSPSPAAFPPAAFPPPAYPPPANPPAAALPPLAPPAPVAPAAPGILPPPIFSSGTSTPLSALGGAAPLVNASAGPSEFTRLISSAPEPVVPPLAPTTVAKPGTSATGGRRMPTGLIVVINAVLLIAALLMFFVLRRPVPTVQTVMPAKPVLPTMPNAPQIPTTPAR